VAADAPLGWRCAEPALATADDWLRSLPHGARISGPALDSCLAGIAARGDLCLAPREAWLPSAAAAATLAGILAASGHRDDPHTLLPDYLRPSYADEKQPPCG
jgi:tRNA A37 threonylcarbamoyladenosine modification protein TsaB